MIYRDHFQNYKRYIIPKAQLIIADIIKKNFWEKANQWLNEEKQIKEDIEKYGFAKTKLDKVYPTLWSQV